MFYQNKFYPDIANLRICSFVTVILILLDNTDFSIRFSYCIFFKSNGNISYLICLINLL